jgi:hypothetical protein
MRHRLLPLLPLFAVLALLVTALTAAARTPATPDARARRAIPDTHVPSDVPSQDNYGAVRYLHFGNAAHGEALIETWTRQTYSDLALPISNQGYGRAVRTFNVERIAIRVVLHTRGGTQDDDGTGPTYNNGSIAGNPRVFNAVSPTISTGGTVPNPQFCESWTTVHYAIRWTDGSLTSGKTLDAPADLFNDNCYFTGP